MCAYIRSYFYFRKKATEISSFASNLKGNVNRFSVFPYIHIYTYPHKFVIAEALMKADSLLMLHKPLQIFF